MANLTYRKINTSASSNPVDHSTVHSTTSAKGTGGLTWAELNGNLYNLNADIATRAPINSPTFTGTVTVGSTDLRYTSSVYPQVAPTLDLDFQHSGRLDNRLSYTRAGSATTVNQKGYIQYLGANTPRFNYNPVTRACRGILIEDVRTNVLSGLNTFSLNNASATESIDIAPDGSWNALAFNENTSNTTQHEIYWQSASVTANLYHTFSVFVKAAGRSRIRLWLLNSTINNGSSIDFNLNTQTFTAGTNHGTGAFHNASIEDYGSGWYRCSMTVIRVDSTSTTLRGYIVMKNDSDIDTYTGDGYSGLLVWGPMIEVGTNMTSYVPVRPTAVTRTSTAHYTASSGVMQSIAANTLRTDYNPQDLSISYPLVETLASTNSIWDSQFTSQNTTLTNNQWYEPTAGNLTLTSNSTVSPNGISNAAYLSCGTTSSFEYISQPTTLSATGIYTFSLYAKPQNSVDSKVSLIISHEASPVNYSRCVFELIGNGQTPTSQSVGTGITIVRTQSKLLSNGWYRIALTVNISTAPINLTVGIYPGSYSAQTVNSKVYIWGAQLEAKQYATSYMPTTTAGTFSRTAETVTWSTDKTRDADLVRMVDPWVSRVLNPDEGTFVICYDTHHKGQSGSGSNLFPRLFSANNDSIGSSNHGFLIAHSLAYGPGITLLIRNQSVVQAQYEMTESIGDQAERRVAFTYSDNSSIFSKDGVNSSEDTSFSAPQGISKITIGAADIISTTNEFMCGHIKSFVYYPIKVSATELAALTTNTLV